MVWDYLLGRSLSDNLLDAATEAATTVNTGRVIDSSAIKNFDFAICFICAWLLPRLVSRRRLYLRTISNSPEWIAKNVTVPGDEAAVDGMKPRKYAQKVVDRAMLQVIGLSVAIYVVVAITLALLTNDLDYRASYILVGISNFVGSMFCFNLSYSAPEWLGVYPSVYAEGRRIPLGTNLRALTIKVRFHTAGSFLKIFPFVAPFFCGAIPGTIPFSILIGAAIGFYLCLVIDFGNRTFKNKKKLRYFALFIAFLFISLSAVLFSYGCGYVQDVWGDRGSDGISTLEWITLFLWFFGGVALHFMAYKISKSMRESGNYADTVISRRPQTFFGASVFVSKSNLVDTKTLEEMYVKPNDDKDEENLKMSIIRESSEVDDDNKSTEDVKDDQEQTDAKNEIETNNKSTEEEVNDNEEQIDDKNEIETKVVEISKNSDTWIDEQPRPSVSFMGADPPDDQPRPKVSFSGADPPDAEQNIGVATTRSRMSKAKSTRRYDGASFGTDDDEDDTACHLCNVVCCHQTCGAGGKTKTLDHKAANFCRWFVWALMLSASLFLIGVLTGAQVQEIKVRKNLPRVMEILYGTMNTAHMCAFDDRGNGTRREKFEATQRTFDTPEEAKLAGYSILHCGACGKCSNWNDLRIEYTSRRVLSRISLECAKKSLGPGGGYPVLLSCTMDQTGFLEPCSRCWATDYQCTRRECIFIGIRAFIINTVTNLQVGEADITPATCEEAMCEATEITGYEGFVPCSGASRRRMNVKSDIARPLDQQCRHVDVLPWEDFYGPSDGHLDYVKGWGE